MSYQHLLLTGKGGTTDTTGRASPEGRRQKEKEGQQAQEKAERDAAVGGVGVLTGQPELRPGQKDNRNSRKQRAGDTPSKPQSGILRVAQVCPHTSPHVHKPTPSPGAQPCTFNQSRLNPAKSGAQLKRQGYPNW